jgi:hypothetical protein
MIEQVIENACDGCYRKDGSATDSVVEIRLAGKTWFLCKEHEDKFADQFTQILGDPMEVGQ